MLMYEEVPNTTIKSIHNLIPNFYLALYPMYPSMSFHIPICPTICLPACLSLHPVYSSMSLSTYTTKIEKLYIPCWASTKDTHKLFSVLTQSETKGTYRGGFALRRPRFLSGTQTMNAQVSYSLNS